MPNTDEFANFATKLIDGISAHSGVLLISLSALAVVAYALHIVKCAITKSEKQSDGR